MTILTFHRDGRRYYFTGDTYPVKHTLKQAGCHWDSAAKRWWTGRRAVAEAVVKKLQSSPPPLAQTRGYLFCRDCGEPAVDTRLHPAWNGYCGDCAYDEF